MTFVRVAASTDGEASSRRGLAKAWASLQRECPRWILGELYACGKFEHGTSAKYPGKVFCREAQVPKLEGCEPTEAQRKARQGAGLPDGSTSRRRTRRGMPSSNGSSDPDGRVLWARPAFC